MIESKLVKGWIPDKNSLSEDSDILKRLNRLEREKRTPNKNGAGGHRPSVEEVEEYDRRKAESDKQSDRDYQTYAEKTKGRGFNARWENSYKGNKVKADFMQRNDRK